MNSTTVRSDVLWPIILPGASALPFQRPDQQPLDEVPLQKRVDQYDRSDRHQLLGVAFTHDGVNEVYAAKRGDLNTISNEFYHKAITGVVDIDEAWDQF